MMSFEGFYVVLNAVDGDGMMVVPKNTDELIEIRLYGIDAPEVKKCKKLKLDEKITRKPGAFLMMLGKMSMKFLIELIPPGTEIEVRQESKNRIDVYGRKLAYVYLKDGRCVNEELIRNGYAKPYTEIFCEELHHYQNLSIFAKQGKKGLYTLTDAF